jgi:hypothetical protein
VGINRASVDDNAPERKILFGMSAAKVDQVGRAGRYWQMIREVFRSRGCPIDPSREDDIIASIWPVLMTAATITQTEASRYCVADPLFEIILCLSRTKKVRDCKVAIDAERRARAAGQVARHLSLWGALTTQQRWLGSIAPSSGRVSPGVGSAGAALRSTVSPSIEASSSTTRGAHVLRAKFSPYQGGGGGVPERPAWKAGDE